MNINVHACVDCYWIVVAEEGHVTDCEWPVGVWKSYTEWRTYVDWFWDQPVTFTPPSPSEEPWFSWSRCDVCGSSLGGDRYNLEATCQ